MRRLAVLALVLVLAPLLAAACGGAGDRAPQASTPTLPPSPDPLAPPAAVPRRASGPAPAGSARVIRAWTRAVRRADFAAAGALFAPGARVQNAGPVVVLPDRAAARRWNALLPCGARVTAIRGERGFAVVRFRLVERRGGDCGTGTGRSARTAIRVAGGRIAEWYRLSDDGRAPALPSGAQPT